MWAPHLFPTLVAPPTGLEPAIFGLGPSPFLLGGVIHQHLNTCRADHPGAVAEIERELYVDDLITGGGTVQETEQKKATTTEIFRQATFHLHKWHSNIPKLEISEDAENEQGHPTTIFGKISVRKTI